MEKDQTYYKEHLAEFIEEAFDIKLKPHQKLWVEYFSKNNCGNCFIPRGCNKRSYLDIANSEFKNNCKITQNIQSII